MMAVGESCPVKACMSYVVGGAMGGFMGLFQVTVTNLFTFPSKLCRKEASSAEFDCDKHRGNRQLTSAFQSSIAPHHTTHQMTTKETLLDMRRKIFHHDIHDTYTVHNHCSPLCLSPETFTQLDFPRHNCKQRSKFCHGWIYDRWH